MDQEVKTAYKSSCHRVTKTAVQNRLVGHSGFTRFNRRLKTVKRRTTDNGNSQSESSRMDYQVDKNTLMTVPQRDYRLGLVY